LLRQEVGEEFFNREIREKQEKMSHAKARRREVMSWVGLFTNCWCSGR
jgi:hypothetical protein